VDARVELLGVGVRATRVISRSRQSLRVGGTAAELADQTAASSGEDPVFDAAGDEELVEL
jgi:hypothetical protein